MPDVQERLARIETNQMHLSKQLDRMVELLDRLVRVEEHVEEDRRDLKRLYYRLEKVEQSISSWKTAKNILIWISGIMSAIITAGVSFFITRT